MAIAAEERKSGLMVGTADNRSNDKNIYDGKETLRRQITSKRQTVMFVVHWFIPVDP